VADSRGRAPLRAARRDAGARDFRNAAERSAGRQLAIRARVGAPERSPAVRSRARKPCARSKLYELDLVAVAIVHIEGTADESPVDVIRGAAVASNDDAVVPDARSHLVEVLDYEPPALWLEARRYRVQHEPNTRRGPHGERFAVAILRLDVAIEAEHAAVEAGRAAQIADGHL